jgi:hypothetical protein
MGLASGSGRGLAVLRSIVTLGLIVISHCCALSATAQSQRQLDLGGFPTGINGDELMARIASYRASLPANAQSSVEIPWAINDKLGSVSFIRLGVGYGATQEHFEFTLDRPAPKGGLAIAKVTSVVRTVQLAANDLSRRDFVSQLEAKFGKDLERIEDRFASRFWLLIDQRGHKREVGTMQFNQFQIGPRQRNCKFQAPNLNWGWAASIDWSQEPISDCGTFIECGASYREPRSAAEAQKADPYGFLITYRCTIVNELLIRNGLVEMFRPSTSAPGKL